MGIVEFKDDRNVRADKPNVRELVGQTFNIISYDLGESERKGKKFHYADITTDKGVYHTASAVLCRQLASMEKTLMAGNYVKVKLRSEGLMLIFDSP